MGPRNRAASVSAAVAAGVEGARARLAKAPRKISLAGQGGASLGQTGISCIPDLLRLSGMIAAGRHMTAGRADDHSAGG